MRLELVQGSVMKTLFTLIFLHGEIIHCLLLFSIHDSLLWESSCGAVFSDSLFSFLFSCEVPVSCFSFNQFLRKSKSISFVQC